MYKRQGQGGAEGGPQKAFVVEEKGLFLEDAVEEMRSKVGGIIDFSALEFLVIGNGLGPDDLWRSLNTVLFFRHIPLASLVLATEEDVGKLMRLSPASGKTFSEVLSGLQAQSRQGLGNVYFPMTWKVMSIIRNEAGDIVLPLMGLTEKGDGLEAIGTAVYDGARRAGRLGPTDSMLLYGIAWRKHLGGTYIKMCIRDRDGWRSHKHYAVRSLCFCNAPWIHPPCSTRTNQRCTCCYGDIVWS